MTKQLPAQLWSFAWAIDSFVHSLVGSLIKIMVSTGEPQRLPTVAKTTCKLSTGLCFGCRQVAIFRWPPVNHHNWATLSVEKIAAFFRPSETKSGRPYGVTFASSLSSCRTPSTPDPHDPGPPWPQTPLTPDSPDLRRGPQTSHPHPGPPPWPGHDMMITWWVLHCHKITWCHHVM